MLVINVYVIRAGANRQRLLLQVLAVLDRQLGLQLHVLGQAARTDIAHLAQFNDIAFL